MFSWLRSAFMGKPKQPIDDDEYHDRFNQAWREAMEAVLGKAEEMEYHSVMPLFLGGQADVVLFRNYVPGYTYVTSDIIGDGSQKKNRLGNYELMICTKQESDWATNLISEVASYTFEAKLKPGDTMEAEGAFPENSTIEKMVFCVPEISPKTFKILDKKCGLLLCIGITQEEFAICRQEGSKKVLAELKTRGIFPYTVLDRSSVF